MGALMATGGMEAIVAIDEAEASGAELDPEALGSGLMISMLVAMLMLIVLVMTFWFAPALVALHEVGVVRSMKLSFQGCLRNIVPFLLYGVILMILSLIALMPVAMVGWSVLLGLLAPVGLLVLWATVIASVYAAYRDIYLYE